MEVHVYHLVKSNSGISFDVPLLTLGDGRLSVEQDAPITIPLTPDAVSGAKIFSGLNHTLLITFWDYLPNLADGLVARGYSEADIEKIFSGNLLRVWRQVEAHAEDHGYPTLCRHAG